MAKDQEPRCGASGMLRYGCLAKQKEQPGYCSWLEGLQREHTQAGRARYMAKPAGCPGKDPRNS